MEGYTYFVIQTKNGAYADRVHNCNNLLGIFERYKNAISVNACKTYKEAQEIARFWNKGVAYE